MFRSLARRLPRDPGVGRRAATWGFVLLILGQLALLGPLLLYRKMEWSYPFLGGDGAEWLSQGLALFGADVRSTGRQPLLPLAAGLFDLAGALRYLPWLPLALAAGLELRLFFLLRRLHGTAVAWACGLYLVLHHGLLEQSVQVMADLAATFLLTVAVAELLDLRVSRWRRAGAVACGAGAVLAQQLALVPLAAVLLAVAVRARQGGEGWHPRAADWQSLLALAGVALPNLLWQLWLRRGGGADAIIPQAQWGYLHLHVAGIDDAAALGVSFFGLPAVGLVLWELGRLTRRKLPADAERASWLWVSVAWLGALLLFLALLYDYRASRFFLYLLPPFVLLLGERLAALRLRPVPFVLAALAAVAGGAWTQGGGPARTGLWPLPPMEVVAGVEGEEDPPLRPRLERTSYRELLRRSLPRRARLAWREKAGERPPSVPGLATVRSVVVLYAEGTGAGPRYQRRDRVALTLRRRAKLAPCSLFPVSWKGWRELREVERSGGLRFLRSEAGAEASPWLLVVPAECLPPGRLGGGEESPAPLLDVALAAEIERRLPGPDGFVAVVPEGEEATAAARGLALSLRTTNFFVVDSATAASLPRTGEAAERLGAFRLMRVRYRRWPVLLVEPAAVGEP